MTYTEPLLLCLLFLAAVGLTRVERKRRIRIARLAVLALFLVAWPPFDWLLSRPLEMRYPVRPFQASPPVEAIVVLSGSVEPAHFERPYERLGYDTFERCDYGAWLYERLHAPVLLCGGVVQPPTGSSAAVMRRYFRQRGVPEQMIWTEEHSRNTYENALFGSRILREHGVHRVALVVDAQSMPRARACFRKQGIDVIPAPSNFREFGTSWQEFLPAWEAIRHNEGTLHESLGLLWYWVRGYI